MLWFEFWFPFIVFRQSLLHPSLASSSLCSNHCPSSAEDLPTIPCSLFNKAQRAEQSLKKPHPPPRHSSCSDSLWPTRQVSCSPDCLGHVTYSPPGLCFSSPFYLISLALLLRGIILASALPPTHLPRLEHGSLRSACPHVCPPLPSFLSSAVSLIHPVTSPDTEPGSPLCPIQDTPLPAQS